MTDFHARILIVEDDRDFRQIVQTYLEDEGFLVHAAQDGLSGLASHRERPADLILLDLMMPNMDGFEFLQILREGGDEVPVLMLTARADERSKLKGFDGGLDDYLTKPFSIVELLSRIRAILRRAGKGLVTPSFDLLVSGPLRLDCGHRKLFLDGEEVEIGLQGVRLLEVLFRGAGQIHSRMELLSLAWEPSDRPTARTVNAHISMIRKQLGEARKWLETIDGMGYIWTHPVERLPG